MNLLKNERVPKWEYAHLEYKDTDHFRNLTKMVTAGKGVQIVRPPSTADMVLSLKNEQ